MRRFSFKMIVIVLRLLALVVLIPFVMEVFQQRSLLSRGICNRHYLHNSALTEDFGLHSRHDSWINDMLLIKHLQV